MRVVVLVATEVENLIHLRRRLTVPCQLRRVPLKFHLLCHSQIIINCSDQQIISVYLALNLPKQLGVRVKIEAVWTIFEVHSAGRASPKTIITNDTLPGHNILGERSILRRHRILKFSRQGLLLVL